MRNLSPAFVAQFRQFSTPQGKIQFLETSINKTKLLAIEHEQSFVSGKPLYGHPVSYPEVCSLKAEVSELETLRSELTC